MRRRRSETIDAQNYDEFLRLSQAPTMPLKVRARNSLPEASLFCQPIPRRASNLPEMPPISYSKSKEAAKTVVTSQDYWDGMDFDSECTRTPSTTASSINSVYKMSIDKDMQEEPSIRDSIVNRVNVMVVGARGSGRHRLVNGLFKTDAENDSEHGIRGAFDLVIKKRGANNEDLYKFWIKDACCEGYKHLFRSYYKTVNVYIFVYQVNNRMSFECLDKAINEIHCGNVRANAIGFLVAGKPDSNEDDREVSYEEGEQLRAKFGLHGFIETSFNYEEEERSVFSALFPENLKIEGK